MIQRCEDCLPHLHGPFPAFDFDGHSIDYLSCKLCGATYECKKDDDEPKLEDRQIILCQVEAIRFVVDIEDIPDERLWRGVTIKAHGRNVRVEGFRVLRTFIVNPTDADLENVRRIEEWEYANRLAELQT